MTTTVRGSAPIALSPESCWAKLRDLTRAKYYVAGLRDSVITTDLQEGVGASRVVTHRLFGAMDETVVEWREGRGFTVRLHKGGKPAVPFREALFRYEIEPIPGGCAIHTEMTYELVLGLLGRILDALVMKRILQRQVRQTALRLAAYYQADRVDRSPDRSDSTSD